MLYIREICNVKYGIEKRLSCSYFPKKNQGMHTVDVQISYMHARGDRVYPVSNIYQGPQRQFSARAIVPPAAPTNGRHWRDRVIVFDPCRAMPLQALVFVTPSLALVIGGCSARTPIGFGTLLLFPVRSDYGGWCPCARGGWCSGIWRDPGR